MKDRREMRRGRLTILCLAIALLLPSACRASEAPAESSKSQSTGKATPSGEQDTAYLCNSSGVKAYKAGKYEEAEKWFRKASQELWGQQDQQFSLSAVLWNLSTVLKLEGKTEESEKLKQQSEDIMKKLSDPALLSKVPARGVEDIGDNTAIRYMMQQMITGLRDVGAGKSRAITINVPPTLDEKAKSATAADDVKNWSILIEKGMRLKGAGNYHEAEEALQSALNFAEKFPKDDMRLAVTYNALGGIYLHTERFGQAAEMYKRALPIAEKSEGSDSIQVARILDNLAGALGSSLNFSEAKPLHQRAIAIYEKQPGTADKDLGLGLSHLAYSEWKLGQRDDAEAHYNRALQLIKKADSDQCSAYGTTLDELALLYIDEKKYKEADAVMSQAFPILQKALGPRHPSVGANLSNHASVLSLMGRQSEAASCYKEALEIFQNALGPQAPRTVGTAAEYASVLRQLHKDAESEEITKSVSSTSSPKDMKLKSDSQIEAEGRPAFGFMMRGNKLSLQGQTDKAMNDFNRAITLDPNLALAYTNRSIIFIGNGDYQAALSDLNKSLALDANSPTASGSRGHVYCLLKQYDKAIKDLTATLRLDPGFVPAYFDRGQAYLELKDFERAIEDLSRFLAIVHNEPTALNLRSKAYEALGKKDLAAADRNAAGSGQPKVKSP